jgi:hypothetical protein
MANDLITFGVWIYVWKIVFIALFLLVAIVGAYPWLLVIAVGLWWLFRTYGRDVEATETGAALPHDEATVARPEPSRRTQA